MAATSCVRQHGTEVGPTVLEGTKVRLFQVYPILQTCSCKLNSHCMALWFWLMRANPLLKLDPSTREGHRQVIRSEATSWDDKPQKGSRWIIYLSYGIGYILIESRYVQVHTVLGYILFCDGSKANIGWCFMFLTHTQKHLAVEYIYKLKTT